MTFVRNGWYCAGWGQDLGATPRAITIMGEAIVLFRGSDGQVTALADRCPHRFAPLSAGKVIGSHIECGYHGLRFDAEGRCVHNPHRPGAIPAAARVKSYPVVERDTTLWLWMGAPERAAAAGILDLGSFWDLSAHSIIYGSFTLEAHYELVLDNLLDLSHAPYLHAGTLSNGPDEVSQLRVETKQEGSVVIANHWVSGVAPTPQFAPPWKARAPVGDFRSNMRWSPPCSLQHDVGITEVGRAPQDGPYLHFAHLLTPATERETHYFWAAARNFDIGDEKVSEALRAGISNAFITEDKPMIEAVQQRMGNRDLFELEPVLLAGDNASVRVRRVLDKLRKAEQAAPSSGAA